MTTLHEIKSVSSHDAPAAWATRFRPLKKYAYEIRPAPFASDQNGGGQTSSCSSASPYSYKSVDTITASANHTKIRVFPDHKNVESYGTPSISEPKPVQRRQFPHRVNARSTEDVWSLPPQKRIIFPKSTDAAGLVPVPRAQGKRLVQQRSEKMSAMPPFATDIGSGTTPPSSKPLSTSSELHHKPRSPSSIMTNDGFLIGYDAASQKQDLLFERRRQIDAMRRQDTGPDAIRAMTSHIRDVLVQSRAECGMQGSNTRLTPPAVTDYKQPSNFNRTRQTVPQHDRPRNTIAVAPRRSDAGWEDDRVLVQNLPAY